jgi:hypothetical protein
MRVRLTLVLGFLALTLIAASALGNGSSTARAASAPHCGRQAARDAVANSPLGDYMTKIVADPTDTNR